SDSGGVLVCEQGLSAEQLKELMEFKNVARGRLEQFAKERGMTFEAGKRPWHVPTDVALPCATQNELNEQEARMLVDNGAIAVAEGANMPSTLEAVDVFLKSGILYAPGKASNAGGVATSGLEMSQNAMRLSWTSEEVDQRLHAIMRDIHANCVRHGEREGGAVNYVEGANIAGFVKLADAMLAQGLV
ncbi:MAG: glutamate dehydrogenase, partial [Ottowia sp.]|nr:glutamate dehydrogenase [Ottowia sp.]